MGEVRLAQRCRSSWTEVWGAGKVLSLVFVYVVELAVDCLVVVERSVGLERALTSSEGSGIVEAS